MLWSTKKVPVDFLQSLLQIMTDLQTILKNIYINVCYKFISGYCSAKVIKIGYGYIGTFTDYSI